MDKIQNTWIIKTHLPIFGTKYHPVKIENEKAVDLIQLQLL